MRDPNENRLELKRDGHRNLQEIKTPHGHWIKFTYDDLSRIKRTETNAGDWAQYEYNADGMLINVLLSSGRQRHYDYQGMLMTEVTDEAGRVLVHNSYEGRLLKRQAFGNGAVYSYRYDWASTSHYPSKVSVTLPDQTTKELSVMDSVPEFVRNYHR